MDETQHDLVCPACGGSGSEAYCPLDGQRRVIATALDPADPLVGKVIAGRYAIERRIGQGGMGAVYIARQSLVERQVVVKVMRADTGFDDLVRGRFLREARAASRVTHPNIITIFDFGYTEDGMAYLVMEYVEGQSLNEVLEVEQRLPWRRAARILAQTARALDAAHKAGIVHRDIKPANVMLAKVSGSASMPAQHGTHEQGQDVVKVLDFGVARLVDGGDARLTRTGAVMGTPAYMAPEQAAGREVGPPADIYALGAMLFDLVTGDVPFAGHNITDVLLQHLATAPPTMRSKVTGLEVPDALEALVAACLAKKPEQRPESAAAVADQLEALANDPSPAMTGARAEAPWLAETGEAAPVQSESASVGAANVGAGSNVAALSSSPGIAAPAEVPAPKKSRKLLRWALAVWFLIAVAAVLVLVLKPGTDVPKPLTTSPTTAAPDASVAHEDAGAEVEAADTSAAAVEVKPPVPLPPIPKPRGLRLDGRPVD